jgi:perosamine synthetase
LHLALIAAGVKKGDEVITTPVTFASTAEVIMYVGAKPVFADIDPRTLNIDPRSVAKKITKRTKAILPVHYGGQPCDMDELNAIARKHHLAIVEDAAHAAGSSYKGQKIGGGKNLAVFSFHAVKNIATGDGGMITTDNAATDKRLRSLRWMGINKSTRERETKGGYRWDYDIAREGGFKYHMNDIAAALGLAQLKKLDGMNRKRREIARVYDTMFAGTKVKPVEQLPQRVNARLNYCIVLDKSVPREKFIAYLAAQGISTGVHYKPLYHHPRYRALGSAKSTPIAESVWKHMLLLPCHPSMSLGDARRVANAVLSYEP